MKIKQLFMAIIVRFNFHKLWLDMLLISYSATYCYISLLYSRVSMITNITGDTIERNELIKSFNANYSRWFAICHEIMREYSLRETRRSVNIYVIRHVTRFANSIAVVYLDQLLGSANKDIPRISYTLLFTDRSNHDTCKAEQRSRSIPQIDLL